MRDEIAALLACITFGTATAAVVTVEAAADNTLYESPTGDLSNGRGDYMFAGRTDAGQLRRAVVRFSLEGTVPPGARVIDVRLTLFMSRTQAGQELVALHRLLADWGEGTSDALGQEGSGAAATPGDATWVHTFWSDQLWQTAGGDFAPGSSAALTVGSEGAYVWGSTAGLVADVQAWVDEPASNFGWILIGDELVDQTTKRFDTRDNLTGEPPRLTVEYDEQPGLFTYFADRDEDGFGDPDDSITVPDPEPPPGFVRNADDCDDTDPDVNPAAVEVCDNGVDDDCNGRVDDCVADDCDGDGVRDPVAILVGDVQDCNRNGTPDACDLDAGTSSDANGNGLPDECETSCCDAGDPSVLFLRYTAAGCEATVHGQDPAAVSCQDLRRPLPAPARLRATDEPEPFAPGAAVWFDGAVAAGEVFAADSTRAGEPDLSGRTDVFVLDPATAALLQAVEFDTSCGEPLAVGDQFGSALVVGCFGEDGDADGDGVVDALDTCPYTPDPAQRDCDGDGIGDACSIAAGLQRDCDADGTPDACAFGLRLEQSPLVRGQEAVLTASGAPPGQLVLFLATREGEGCGPCAGGTCLQLVEPVARLGQVVADAAGTAALRFVVPFGLPAVEVSTQAITLDAARRTATSNPITARVRLPR